jgi:hypothetical protein
MWIRKDIRAARINVAPMVVRIFRGEIRKPAFDARQNLVT